MKKKVFIFMLVMFFSYFLNITTPEAVSSKNMDVFNGIVKYTNGEIIEYGLDLSVNSHDLQPDDLDKIIKSIPECKGAQLSSITSDNTYCINFTGKNINGYIESTKISSGYNVKLELIIKGNKNNIDGLLGEIKNIDLFKNNGVEVFRYMKVKLSSGKSIKMIDDEIVNYLKSKNADNINTIKLNNAYSTTAYTGNEDYIMEGNKAVDISIAVSRYTSGTYIIIGTPQIIISY